MSRSLLVLTVIVCVLNLVPASIAAESESGARRLSLDECVTIAIENNQRQPVSQAAVAVAEAQLQQALSAFRPHLSLHSQAYRTEEDPHFVFPEENANYTVLAPAIGVVVPTEFNVTIPEKVIKFQEQSGIDTSLQLTYPLYTGGRRRAAKRQAQQGLAAAKEGLRKTEHKVMYDVQRMYFGAVLARRLHDIAKNTLERMESTLALTERLYKYGSGRVKKTDYLRNKVTVAEIKSVVGRVAAGQKMAKAALVNTLGLLWKEDIEPADDEVPYEPIAVSLENMVETAYRFSPDWKRLEAALRAASAGVARARGEGLPVLAIQGSLDHRRNAYDKGIVSPPLKHTWTVGVGLTFPLFTGGLTRGRIREARARLKKLEHEQLLFKSGLALMVQKAFLDMEQGVNRVEPTLEALESARENRSLTVRAYQSELVETKEVIEAQLMEALVKAGHEKARYDHLEARCRLDYIVGSAVQERVAPGPETR